MPERLRRVVSVFRAALACGLLGLVLLAMAIATAWLRLAECGPSRLDALEAACRLGAQMLVGAYAVLGVALVLGALSLSLLWRFRRDKRSRASR